MSTLGRVQAYGVVTFISAMIVAAGCEKSGDGAAAVSGGSAGESGLEDPAGSPASGAGGSDSTPAPAHCETDKDCRAFDQLCDQTRNLCVQCLASSDCEANQDCVDGSCKTFTPCDSTRDCPLDQVCDRSQQRCVECVGDNDCCVEQSACTRMCVANACKQKCESDKDCRSLGLLCDLTAGYCVECLTDSDCAEGRSCEDRSCKVDGNAAGGAGGTGSGGSAGQAGNSPENGGNGGATGGQPGQAGAGGTSPGPRCSSPLLIDDMEDGDTQACRHRWYTIKNGVGTFNYAAVDISGGHTGSRKALHVTASFASPGGLLGIATDLGTSSPALDASGSSGFEFWAKGSVRLGIGVHMPSTIKGGGFVLYRQISGDWKRYQVLFSELYHPSLPPFNPKEFAILQFWLELSGEVWIDDIALIPK